MKVLNSISHYRRKYSLTQSQLGNCIGVSKNSISSIECGLTMPSIKVALSLSFLFGVSVEKLFYLYSDLDTVIWDEIQERFLIYGNNTQFTFSAQNVLPVGDGNGRQDRGAE